MEAKDRVMQECRSTITRMDASIQKFLKVNGARQVNPKEEGYVQTILSNYDKLERIQDEKVILSEKAAILVSFDDPLLYDCDTDVLLQLDRQVKRLDVKIRDLQTEGAIAPDPLLPSTLNSNTTLTPRFPPLSASTTGLNTPLHPIAGNVGPSTTIANSAIARLVQPQSATSLRHPSLSLPPSYPLSASGTSTPTVQSIHLHQRARESSLGASDSKRRRLNAITAPGSSLRQSSLGPGTPKPGTPGSVRGGSAGPGRAIVKKPNPKKVAPHQRVGHLNPNSKKASSASARRRASKKGSGVRPSPSTGGDDSALSDAENSESERNSQASAALLSGRGNGDAELEDAFHGEGGEEDEEQGDDRKYCTCRSVSYGNMIACDNDDCAYEWFHWSCVGMTKEPAGKWFCAECRAKLNI